VTLLSLDNDLATPVLGVARSGSNRRWRWRDRNPEIADASRQALMLAQRTGIPELVARILVSRGIRADAASLFLDPKLRAALPDPSCLRDMDQAASRLSDAIINSATVGIFGDYDVDGACSTALLSEILETLGCHVISHIPDRMTEGYGPNIAALQSMIDRGATLLICADCGTAAVEILNTIAIQTDIIVLDHHKPDGTLLPNAIVVNPNRLDCTSGLYSICATAVVFLTLIATIRKLRHNNWFETHPCPDLMRALDLVALATVCDVMPLTGLNRALVTQGLRIMAQGQRLGLTTLASVAGVKDNPTAMTCGFAFGPRINAGGRIAQSGLGLKLLTSRDAIEARAVAEQLDEVNRKRQTVEASILQDAILKASAQCNDGHAVLFLHGSQWHPGVVGIVAGRIKEKYNRPAFVGAEYEGVIKGSARSIPGLDLGAAVIAARQAGLLLTGGGHAMAAGFSLRSGDAAAFHNFMDERLAEARLRPLQDDLLIDDVLSLKSATYATANELAKLAPFGPGNEEPQLALAHVRCVQSQHIGRDGNTLRLTLQAEDGGTRLKGLVFRATDKPYAALFEDASHPLLHVVGWLRAERWQDRDTLSLVITDAAMA